MEEYEMWTKVFETMGISRVNAPHYAKILQMYEMNSTNNTRDTVEGILFLDWYDFQRACNTVAHQIELLQSLDDEGV